MKEDGIIKVSVIVPIYNKEKYIKRCLESLQQQSLKEIEIICVNDGSQDNSGEIVATYRKADDRIVFINNEKNMGTSYSRNKALSVARGKYIFFLDADDYLDCYALEHYYNELNGKDADMCFIGFEMENESLKKRSSSATIRNTYPAIYRGEELLGKFVANDEFFLYACMVVYKRTFIEENELKFIKLKCGEGGEFILKALVAAEKVIVSEYKGYHYCLNDDSVNADESITAEALLGQVVQYIHMLRRAVERPDSLNIIMFLNWYRIKMKGAISNLSGEGIGEIRDRLEDEFSRHIWSVLANTTEADAMLLSADGIEMLKQERKVLLYGAGYETWDTLQLLNKYRMEVLGIIVTKKEGNPETLYGHRIYDVKYLENFDSKTLIVVTAHEKHQKSICEELSRYGFYKIICVRRR